MIVAGLLGISSSISSSLISCCESGRQGWLLWRRKRSGYSVYLLCLAPHKKNGRKGGCCGAESAGTQFTCSTSTKIQIPRPEACVAQQQEAVDVYEALSC